MLTEHSMTRGVNKTRKITPEKAVAILKNAGTDISLQDAKCVLDLMYKFAKLSIKQQIER